MAAHHLPAQPTPFISRADELADIIQLLHEPACRLLTLVGPGGIGKTRLALEAANRWIQSGPAPPDHPPDACFVPLQPLGSPDLIVSSIASALHFQFSSQRDPRQQLLEHLTDKSLLLLLDNFEHLLAGSEIASEIVQTAPGVKILATSREILNLREEWRFPVTGLSFPDSMGKKPLADYGAVELFVQCARRAQPDFALDREAEWVIKICQLVEGMPLALEMAAAWLKRLPCKEIARELEQGLDILEATARNIEPRHRSIRAVLDHSWDLLSEDEQTVYMKLAVFHGGFRREAAEAVADASLATLSALVDKSLLRVDADGRYSLHELVRQYAAEKLDQMPAVKAKTLDLHCDYYTEFLHQQEATIHLSDQSHVVVEIDNVRAAWQRAVQQRNLGALQRAAPSLHWLYHFQSWIDEGAAVFYQTENALRTMATTEDGRFMLGMIQLFRSFYHPPTTYPPVDIEAALALCTGLNERPVMGLLLTRAMLGLLNQVRAPRQVIAVAREGLNVSRRHNDLPSMAISLATLAVVSWDAFGEFAQARQLLEEALAIDYRIGFELNARWCEILLGNISEIQGKHTEAIIHFEASVAHHYSGNIRKGLDSVLYRSGIAALELNEDDKARHYFEASIAEAADQQRHEGIAQGRAGLGILAAFQGDGAAAAAYYEDSLTCLQAAGMQHERPEAIGYLALLLGRYDDALAHYEATLSRYQDSGYRISIMRVRCRVGLSLVGLADEIGASPHLFEAVREAADTGALLVQLEALLGIAQLSVVPPALAADLLALVCEHPASTRYCRTQAERLLATMDDPAVRGDFRAAIEGGQALTLEAATALVAPFYPGAETAQQKANQQLIDPLSSRELEILTLMAAGHTNQEIADQLYIGVSTVKKHINHIYSKLDVTHRAQAVAYARSLNILP